MPIWSIVLWHAWKKHDNLDPVLIKDSIKKVGAKRCLMATDFGQIHNPSPVNGMKMFIEFNDS